MSQLADRLRQARETQRRDTPASAGSVLALVENQDLMRRQVEKALPMSMRADHFARVLLTECRKTPRLLECSRESFLAAVMTAAQLGLEPGPLGKATRTEMALRRERVRELYRQGYGASKIAAHLGISETTIQLDLAAVGIKAQRRPKSLEIPASEPGIPRIAHDEGPRWHRSRELAWCEGLLRDLRACNGRAQFGTYCREARAEGDEAWLEGASEPLGQLLAYLAEMMRATVSSEVADRLATTDDGRDDIGGTPRLAVLG